MLSRFYLIPERYWQMDGRTDRRTDRFAISISVCWRAIKTNSYCKELSYRCSECTLTIYTRHWLSMPARIPCRISFIDSTLAADSRHLTSAIHCVSKNAPTLATCSFDKHGPISIIFGQQHQHTFRKKCAFNFSCTFTFYLLYLLLNTSV